jgi:3-oxo-5alpha-steroid 4-dehydrogenase
MGGLTVDEATGQVKDLQGGVIKGLYAAGRTAVGIPSYLYMSGLSIADCVFSGLRAADHASETLHNEISEPAERQ